MWTYSPNNVIFNLTRKQGELKIKIIGRLKANDVVGKILENDIYLKEDGGPYEFKFNDGYGKEFNLYKKAEKVKKWAEKNGALVDIKKPEWGAGLILVITDPVASHLEMFLKGF